VPQPIHTIPGTETQLASSVSDFTALRAPPGLRERARRAACAALVVLAGLSVGRAAAQRPTSSISGVVLNRQSRTPIEGALVRLRWTGRSVAVDSAGRFELRGLAPGTGLLQIRAIGYQIGSWAVNLAENSVLADTFELDPVPIVLTPLLVPTNPVDDWRSPEGFEQRRRKGGGYFITGEQIKQQAPLTLVEVLRTVPGILTSCSHFRCAAVMQRSTPPCSPEYFLDGFPATIATGPDFPIQSIRGIEVYGDEFSTPIEFQRFGLHCGVIALWTEMRR
jgi:hypothetical protein